MGIEDELKAMNALSEAPSTQAAATEAPGTTAPGTTAPGTTAPGTEAPGTTAPTTEAPKEEDELTKTKRELESLRAKLDEAHGKKEEKGTPATKAPGTKAPGTAAPPEDADFVGDVEDLEDLMRDPKEFNKILNKVYKQAYSKARKDLGEGVLRSIPEIVKVNINTITALKKANEDFYEANEDLIPYKKIVAASYESVASEHPDWTVEKALEETGKLARKTLELNAKTQANQSSQSKQKPPKLPTGSKGKQSDRQKPKTSGLLAEIDAMNADLE